MEEKSVEMDGEGRIVVLEQLVEEMIKSSPREEKIKGFMEKSGLDYVEDPIDRINCVLEALEFSAVEAPAK